MAVMGMDEGAQLEAGSELDANLESLQQRQTTAVTDEVPITEFDESYAATDLAMEYHPDKIYTPEGVITPEGLVPYDLLAEASQLVEQQQSTPNAIDPAVLRRLSAEAKITLSDLQAQASIETPESSPAPTPDAIAAALLPEVPPAPGTLNSKFRRCDCLGTLPGRACIRCSSTRWLKECPHCAGHGKISKIAATQLNFRGRNEVCGYCLGKGTLPGNRVEIAAAQLAHEAGQREFDAAVTRQKLQGQLTTSRPPQHRGAQLPGADPKTPVKKREAKARRDAAKAKTAGKTATAGSRK